MGMFKDIGQLKKMGNEANQRFEAEGGMAGATDKLRAANEMLAQQTAAANLAVSGADATAMITSVAQTGAMVNYQPMLNIDMTVMAPGLPPYPASVSQVVEQIYLAKAAAGNTVNVKVDPNAPSTVYIDWLNS
jgi:hypothetical protein